MKAILVATTAFTVSVQAHAFTPYIDATAAPYNVKCDGVTNDTAGINAALTAAQTGQTKVVILPAGTCLVSTPIKILGSSIVLAGQGGTDGSLGGGSGTAIQTNSATGDVIQIGSATNNVSGVVVRDLSVTSSVTKTGGSGIHRYAGAWNYVRSVKVLGTFIGYKIDGTCQSGSGNCDYDNFTYDSSFNSNSNAGIQIGLASSTTTNGYPQNEFFYNLDVSLNGTGVNAINCGGCNFNDVQGIQNGTGMKLSPGNSQETNVFANNLQWDSSVGNGIVFQATGTGRAWGHYRSIWFASSGGVGSGIVFNQPASAYAAGLEFTGGWIFNNGGTGVWEEQATNNVSFIGVNNQSNNVANGGFPNYSMHDGTTNLVINGGMWGGAPGFVGGVPTYGIQQPGGTVDRVSIADVNLRNVGSSGSCTLGGTTLIGGILCVSATNSATAGVIP